MRNTHTSFDYDDFRSVESSPKKSIAMTVFDFFYPLVIGLCIVWLACAFGYVDRSQLAMDGMFRSLIERWI